MEKSIFDVVGALIKKDEKYLVCKRKEDDTFGSLWEFPGGKVEEGEDKIAALKREIKEELDIEIEVKNLIDTFEDEILDKKINVYLYSAFIIKGEPCCVECQDLKWTSLEEMKALSLAPADQKIFLHLTHN